MAYAYNGNRRTCPTQRAEPVCRFVPENAYRQCRFDRAELDPRSTAACVSLLQNHNVKERPFRGRASKPARIEPKPDKRGPKPSPGPGGRRGFYARPLAMSTTFSRKKRISQTLEKHQKNQRVLCALGCRADSAGHLRIATITPYRFA